MTQNAVDAEQRNQTDKIDTNITYLERTVKDLINNIDILKIRVDELPDIADLNLILDAVRAKNVQLEQAADMQNSELLSLMSKVQDVSDTLTSVG